jgi:hypothetical protein
MYKYFFRHLLPSHKCVLKKSLPEWKLLRASSRLGQCRQEPTRFPIPLFDRHSLPRQLMVLVETLQPSLSFFYFIFYGS